MSGGKLTELLKRALCCYQSVETRRGEISRRAALRLGFKGSVVFSLSPDHPSACPRLDGTTAELSLLRIAGLPEPAEGGREADRQTDRSDGYGPSLRMLESPYISLLVWAGDFFTQVGTLKKFYAPKTVQSHSCHGCWSEPLSCWPNSLIFFNGWFFDDQTASSFNAKRHDVIRQRLSVL